MNSIRWSQMESPLIAAHAHLMDERRCFLLMNLMAYRLMSCRFSTSLTFPCTPSPSRLTSRYCLLTTGMPLAVRWMVSPVVVRSSCQIVWAFIETVLCRRRTTGLQIR